MLDVTIVIIVLWPIVIPGLGQAHLIETAYDGGFRYWVGFFGLCY